MQYVERWGLPIFTPKILRYVYRRKSAVRVFTFCCDKRLSLTRPQNYIAYGRCIRKSLEKPKFNYVLTNRRYVMYILLTNISCDNSFLSSLLMFNLLRLQLSSIRAALGLSSTLQFLPETYHLSRRLVMCCVITFNASKLTKF